MRKLIVAVRNLAKASKRLREDEPAVPVNETQITSFRRLGKTEEVKLL